MLRRSRYLVAAGDPCQLPPLVASPSAVEQKPGQPARFGLAGPCLLGWSPWATPATCCAISTGKALGPILTHALKETNSKAVTEQGKSPKTLLFSALTCKTSGQTWQE